MIGCKFKFGKDTWELHIHGKYSFIVGDSSSGKSFLETSVSQYAAAMGSLPIVSGYRLVPYIVFVDLDVDEIRPTDIVIVDEEAIRYSNVSKRNIYKRAEQTPCYFIFCTRELPTRLPYGYEDIFLLGRSGHYHEMVRLLQDHSTVFSKGVKLPDIILTEDSKSGFLAMQSLYGKDRVRSAFGRSAIPQIIARGRESISVYLDLCGAGNIIPELVSLLEIRLNVRLLNSKSFECDALRNKRFRDRTYATYNSDGKQALRESEESYYSRILSEWMHSEFNIAYDKGSRQCLSLLTKDKSWLPSVVSEVSALRRLERVPKRMELD